MLSDPQNTALIIFARSEIEEAKSKKLHPGNWASQYSLIKCLSRKTLQLAINSGLSYFVFDESNQMGNHFGEKLAHAFQSVFTRGFENVIAIGSDCPSLTTDDISTANAALTASCSVIGPDRRRGAYLIGMNVNQFDFDRFSNLAWQAKNTIHSLLNYFEKSVLIKKKSDFNQFNDLKQVLKELSSQSFKYLILKINGFFIWINSAVEEAQYFYQFSSQKQKRGPPIY